MKIIFIILLVIWGIGFERIGRKHSKETISSLFGFSPAETTLKGYFYIIIWTIVMILFFGLMGLMIGGI